jgi:ethanolamine kinase
MKARALTIDRYATPCPAAFDLANHFAEWVGFRCDYNLLPSKSQRRAFITDYLISYHAYKHQIDISKDALEKEVDQLEKDVDTFRGIPGFYWGIWALIQAQISQIDFDYAGYAAKRLGEYWDWKKTLGGEKSESLREQVWGRE